MFSKSELRRKIVINMENAERIGNVSDIDVDVLTGKIKSIIIPKNDIISIFTRKREIVIPWSQIISVGSEFILVNMPTDTEIVTLM